MRKLTLVGCCVALTIKHIQWSNGDSTWPRTPYILHAESVCACTLGAVVGSCGVRGAGRISLLSGPTGRCNIGLGCCGGVTDLLTIVTS